jgi:SAM-dependent methyltransferase
MKRYGIYRPTVEEVIEMSGIETLHPGGLEISIRTIAICDIKKDISVLDVSCGRGTLAIYISNYYEAKVTGLDISEEMIFSARLKSRDSEFRKNLNFILGDSQNMPLPDNSFDVVINECSVGIPDDSQKVLNEMMRVTKPGGSVVFHESTWRKKLSDGAKSRISESYGTTPLEYYEWIEMFEKAGATDLIVEFDRWSSPEMFWEIRENRRVVKPRRVLTVPEKAATVDRIMKQYGISGVVKAYENEKVFFQSVLSGELGYALYKGTKC